MTTPELRELGLQFLGDLAVALGVVVALFGLWWGLLRNRRDGKTADDAAQDRLLKLIEEEAEKRVKLVRTDLELKIAEQELEHQREMRSMRREFEDRLSAMRRDLETYRCDNAAAGCPNRRIGDLRPEGTD